MIEVIDYGAGNLRSVVNTLEAIGVNAHVTREPSDILRAEAIVLPGVGAFGDGMQALRRLEIVEALDEAVLVRKTPYLGICLGLQFLADEGFENGHHRGLGWIHGQVEIIHPAERQFRIPHIGWNNIEPDRDCPLFEGLDSDPVFYFVHSYALVPQDGDGKFVAATVHHGAVITAAVWRENIFGVQFHPEKSQQNGMKVLENFIKYIGS